jgi:L-asparaginase/Glu-tRNA(Gln) amidotransferase subunit D
VVKYKYNVKNEVVMNKKHICIIHTGGTIGMIRSSHGYLPKAGYLETVLDSISDLKDESMPAYTFYEINPLLDSSDMAVNDWNKIGEEIAQRYNDYDGFVVLHGTDTMAYTASALSFMLKNLNKPVVLTGSQIPLCEVRSDGQDNLITSLIIASDARVKEVCLYFIVIFFPDIAKNYFIFLVRNFASSPPIIGINARRSAINISSKVSATVLNTGFRKGT